jgi:dipeptide/tripeptide permease
MSSTAARAVPMRKFMCVSSLCCATWKRMAIAAGFPSCSSKSMLLMPLKNVNSVASTIGPPALVMILIPFNNLVLYPALRRWGVVVTPLRRMGFGIAFSGFAWIAAGAIQLAIDGGDAVSITWQVLPYVLLTFR